MIKRVIWFLVMSIFTILILASIPMDIIFMDDEITLTRSQFDKLLASNSVCIDEVLQCTTNDEERDIQQYAIKYKLFNLFDIKKLKVDVVSDRVFVGGKALGFSINTKGVIVVGSNYILTRNGKISPISSSGLRVGDIITSLNGIEVISVQDILDILQKYTGGDIDVSYIREGGEYHTSIIPGLDIQTNSYKLGLWLKEGAMGIGTLTYVDSDANYGALGHAISLDSTGKPLDITGGNVYNCNIVGTKIGSKGNAGQLLGVFNTGESAIGTLDINNDNGAYGKIYDIARYSVDMDVIDVGGYGTVKPGRAKILSCIGGYGVKEYDIDIIKTNYKGESGKSMIIRVVDPDLIRETGGIVQGMSGSPIIQGGKLVGAVTHVFLNDATKGFGLYIDWMM